MLARSTEQSPRAVLGAYGRRSISDREWRERYVDLFPASL
jgi:hypothetical protein